LRPLHGYEANEAIAFGYPREACVEQQALWPLAIGDERHNQRRATASSIYLYLRRITPRRQRK